MIYRSVSQTGFYFVAEMNQHPIGEACLQQMNLERILERYPGKDCRRIDLIIGEKALWGQGIGSKIIAMLTAYAFETEHADLVFGCDIGDYNPRSLSAFHKAGFQIVDKIKELDGHKAQYVYDTLLTREQFLARRDVIL
jgi:RimJ/RimL family protein N-acetyltransferase